MAADPDEVRAQGSAASDRDPSPRRTRHHAADRRLAVEGSPLQPRPPEGRHRAARLRPADPLVEYKKESFALFTAMKDRIEEEIVRYLWRLTPVIGEEGAEPPAPVRQPAPRRPPQLTLSGPSTAAAASPFGAIGGSRGPASAVAEPPGRRVPRAPAETMPSARSSAKSRRSAATIRVRAAAARNTRSATGPRRATCNVPRAGNRARFRGSNDGCCPFVFEE